MTRYRHASRLLATCLSLSGLLAGVGAVHDYANSPPSYEDFVEIEALVLERIVLSSCPDEADVATHWDWDGGTDCTLFPRNQGRFPLAARLVRLAFHDATGEMDGYCNMTNPEHAGLQPAISVLDMLHDEGQMFDGRPLQDVVSLADLFSWAGIAAVRFTADRQNEDLQPAFVPTIKARYGRETYTGAEANAPQEQFPVRSALSTGAELEEYFEDKFGFDAADTVALMGAHSLGQGRQLNSGFRSPWDSTPLDMDEAYYSEMVSPPDLLQPDDTCAEEGRCEGWEQVRIGNRNSGIYQWRHSCDANGNQCDNLMLNVDIGLLYDIDDHICDDDDNFPAESGGGSCRKGEVKSFPADSPIGCTWGDRLRAKCFHLKSATSTQVLINSDPFARNAWLVEFARVFDEMMTVSSLNVLTEVMDTEPPTAAPTNYPTRPPSFVPQTPNFIVFQPDDMQFFEDWTPPAHSPNANNPEVEYPGTSTLPNINKLRADGIQMTQAYTASPMCGTSRYSTMTGRYASRSSYGRNSQAGQDVAGVSIPTTKLEDLGNVADGNDCSANNLAQLFKANQYRTGVVGKWHLSATDRDDYVYEDIQDDIRSCGFDFAEAIYHENMDLSWTDGSFSHNMEYIAHRAIEFIEDSADPFFLYVNPTAPHGSGNVLNALRDFECTDTPATVDPTEEDLANIPGMTAELGGNCTAYRESVITRANGETNNNALGSIWVDDAVGAIIESLERTGKLENTFFLFQLDHGQEGKGALYETGIRIPQFVHYPEGFGRPNAMDTFDGLVSTIDIGPTIIDYAGIDSGSDGWYPMDGKSWRTAISNVEEAASWCLTFEHDKSRAVRCGCNKFIYMSDYNNSDTRARGETSGLAHAEEILFDLCDGEGNYIDALSEEGNPEENPSGASNSVKEELKDLIGCHLDMTDSTKTPNYYECAPGWTSAPTKAPTATPTETPTESPTETPIVCQDDLVDFTDGQGRPRDCDWVDNKVERCAWDRFGQYCPVVCGFCDA